MSLNDLQLPDLVIAALYKNNLLVEHETASAEQTPAPKKNVASLPILGSHLKRTAVLVSYPEEVYLPEAQLNFLANILKACNLTLGDIGIINLSKVDITLAILREHISPEKIIFFNVNPVVIGIDDALPEYSIRQYQELSVLRAPALDRLNQPNEESRILKSKLWLCLKEFFNVSSTA